MYVGTWGQQTVVNVDAAIPGPVLGSSQLLRVDGDEPLVVPAVWKVLLFCDGFLSGDVIGVTFPLAVGVGNISLPLPVVVALAGWGDPPFTTLVEVPGSTLSCGPPSVTNALGAGSKRSLVIAAMVAPFFNRELLR